MTNFKNTDYENAMHIDALKILAKNNLGDIEGNRHAYNCYKQSYEYFLYKLKKYDKFFYDDI